MYRMHSPWCCLGLLFLALFSALPISPCVGRRRSELRGNEVPSVSFALTNNVYASSYRKDAFLPYREYPEYRLPDPVKGGRIHIVGTARSAGDIAAVYIDNQLVNVSVGADWSYDWMHTYPMRVENVGDPLWISFHSRDSDLYDITPPRVLSLKVVSMDGETVLMDGSFIPFLNNVSVTYVVPDDDWSVVYVHVFNGDSVSRTATRVIFNGIDITSSVPGFPLILPADEASILSVKPPKRISPGQLWTVQIDFQEIPSIGYGGRFIPSLFPIEVWPKSEDCPFKGVNDSAFNWHISHGVDTFFLESDYLKTCNTSITALDVVNSIAPANGFYTLPGNSLHPGPGVLTNDKGIAALFLADENDGKVDDQMRSMIQDVRNRWSWYPTMATYQGGHSNRLDGAFAGLTDIQGMDMYVAACAPHIQDFLHPPPLWGSFDYLRITRDNHKPLPTWTYSQGLSDVWSEKIPIIGKEVYRNPNPTELRIQMMSVLAAGSKGIMLFQSAIKVADEGYADSWEEWRKVALDIRGLRHFLRIGDRLESSKALIKDDLPVESFGGVVYTPTALIIILVLTKNDGGYSDIGCAAAENMHWRIVDHTISTVQVSLPYGFPSVSEVFEVQNGQILTASVSMDPSGRSVSFKSTKLSPQLASRVFVIASDAAVRQRIQSDLLMSTKDNWIA